MKFKVIDPKGIHFGDTHLKEGKVFRAERKNPRIATFLHFKQVEETEEDEDDAPEEEKDKSGKGKTKAKDAPLV